jgi:hypothetical protein
LAVSRPNRASWLFAWDGLLFNSAKWFNLPYGAL